MIVIVDLCSNGSLLLQRALEELGFPARTSNSPEVIANAEKLILSGNGSFEAAMNRLRKAHLIEPLLKHISSGKPFLGAALGLELLFDWSQEQGITAGLGVVCGKVVPAPSHEKSVSGGASGFGWRALEVVADSSRLLQKVRSGSEAYFTAANCVLPDDEAVVTARSRCEASLVAAIERDNLMASLFSPEQSGEVGLQLLRNFGAV